MLLEWVRGSCALGVYFVACAGSALLLRRFVRMPREVFRKTLHFIVLGSIFLFVYEFDTWWLPVAAATAFILLAYPLLSLAERIPGYSELLTERRPGEIKRSLVAVFFMFAALIALCWGWLGQRYLVIASVLAWGLGDAAAALAGKRFGRHYVEGKLVEGRKSLEGTLAMFVVSFFTVLAVLLAHNPVAWYLYAPISAFTAAVCATVELFTRNGMDTLTCPFAVAAVLIPLCLCL